MADTLVTAQTIIDNCVSRRKDIDKTSWSDTELLAYLNKAIDNVGMMLIYLESELAIHEATVTLVAATQEYVMTDSNITDFWAMARAGVYFANVETPLISTIYNAKIRGKDTATDTYPLSYYITSSKIGVIGIPSATAIALTGGNALKCRYFKKPTVLALDGNMPYGNIFNESASLFMDSVAALRDEMDMTAYDRAKVLLENIVYKVVQYRNPVGPKALSPKAVPEKG